jgi:O-antigen/teichoic acid export membrane protein
MPVIGFFIKINAIFLTLNGLAYIATATLQGFQRIKTLSVINVLMNALNLPIYFIFIWEMGLLGAVIAGVVSIVINLIITIKCVKDALQQENVKLNIVFDRKIRGILLKFSFPLFLSILVLRPADLFAISYLSVATGFESAGLYRIAAGLSRLILFIPAALTLPLLPMFSELYASNMDKQNIVSRIIKLVILICLPISLAIGLGARYIISLLYGQEYVGAAFLTYILCISAFVDSIAIVIVSLLHGTGRTWHGLGIDIFQAIVIVATSYYFISLFGLIGIGYANLLKISLLTPLLIFYLTKKSELDSKLLKSSLILAVLVITSSFFVMRYNQIAYFILFIIIVIIIEIFLLSSSDKELIGKAFKKYKFDKR